MIKKVANFYKVIGRFLSLGFIFLTVFAFSGNISANPHYYLNQTQIQNLNNQFILSSKVKAQALEIETSVLKLITQKDLDYLQETSDTSEVLIRTITDKGHQPRADTSSTHSSREYYRKRTKFE